MKQILTSAMIVILPVATILYSYGTLSPCGIVRSQMRQEAVRAGGLGGAVASMLPDAVIDGLIAERVGHLSPGRCLAVALGGAQQSPATPQPARLSTASPQTGRQSVTAPQGSPEALRQASLRADAGMKECQSKRLSGQLKTYAEAAQCSGAVLYHAYALAGYRYMDLIAQLKAKQLELSESIDLGIRTEAQAGLEMARFTSTVIDEERQRDRGQR